MHGAVVKPNSDSCVKSINIPATPATTPEILLCPYPVLHSGAIITEASSLKISTLNQNGTRCSFRKNILILHVSLNQWDTAIICRFQCLLHGSSAGENADFMS